MKAINMTGFFKRELMMYALGDINLKKPISLVKLGYTAAFLVIWTVPWVLILGATAISNVAWGAWVFGIPIGLGHVATMPIFGGKKLFDWAKTSINFIKDAKVWGDTWPLEKLSKEVYYVDDSIWVSRRRELALLGRMRLNDDFDPKLSIEEIPENAIIANEDTPSTFQENSMLMGFDFIINICFKCGQPLAKIATYSEYITDEENNLSFCFDCLEKFS